jgi:hypothetical protein
MTRVESTSNTRSRSSPAPASERVQWKGRDAMRLANGTIELISLTGGGHLACFRFLDREGCSQNVLWEAPWPTIDPATEWPDELLRLYGPGEIGKYLASYTGHALCLDYFGEPSNLNASLGLSLHGEAAITQWSVMNLESSAEARARWNVSLPVAQLSFERKIRLGKGQSVAYIEEAVFNALDSEHVCDWVQHVTFGPPFLQAGESVLEVSAHRGFTASSSYEGRSLLAANRDFVWPYAPRDTAEGIADLRQPFSVAGFGFLAGVQLDIGREQEFILAINWVSRVGVGYCFRRCDFPWMTIWEENNARQDTPWFGKTAARGMEFGTTPLPRGKQEGRERISRFETPIGCVIPAHGKREAKYLMFLFEIPPRVHSIKDATAIGDAILLSDEHGNVVLSIPAKGCETFLAQGR